MEARGIRLLRNDSGASVLLGYPEAALWDLVSRGKPYTRLVAEIAAITQLNAEGAERFVHDKVEEWTEQGWLVKLVSDG